MITAKQVPPEEQMSPLLEDGMFPDNIAVFGNRDFQGHIPENVQRVVDAFNTDYIYSALEDTDFATPEDKELLEENLPPRGREHYSQKEADALKKIIFDESYYYGQEKYLCAALGIIENREWDYKEIHGSCQGDWNKVFYPTDEWSKNQIDCFAADYFNEGSEWLIQDYPEKGDGYISLYCYSYDPAGIREEIANCLDEKPEEIKLEIFDRYKKIPLYIENSPAEKEAEQEEL